MRYTTSMLLSHNQSTEDALVKLLSYQEKEAKDIQVLLNKELGKKITIQALYRSIKRLVNDGVLVKKGLLFTVNKEWVQNLVNYFDKKGGMQLAEAEDISYSFKTLSALDSYWKHTITQFRSELGDYPVFFYNNHVVWLHLKDRKESQTNYLNNFDAEKRYAGFVVGGDSAMDKEFKKVFSKKYLQAEIRKIDSIRYDSITVHGDYVVTVKFNKRTNELVDRLYKTSKSIQELEEGLEKSLEGNLPVKLTIEKNALKAEKLRKILSKNFYIPKEIKTRFDL